VGDHPLPHLAGAPLSLPFRIRLERDRYAPGEAVVLTLAYENVGPGPVATDFAEDACVGDVVVEAVPPSRRPRRGPRLAHLAYAPAAPPRREPLEPGARREVALRLTRYYHLDGPGAWQVRAREPERCADVVRIEVA